MTFAEFCRAHGLIVDHIPADGYWHRYRTETHKHKKNGAAKLAMDGRIGWVCDHAAATNAHTWRAGADYVAPRIDHAAIAGRREAERKVQKSALQDCMRFWMACAPLRGGHPYLESHGLDMTGCSGLKVDADGWLVVPALRNGEMRSVQRISTEGDKRFWPGLPVSGSSYLIARRNPSITVVCEGLATGLAVFAACPATRVIVGFDAGNMAKVEIPHRGLVVVAADNDLATAERVGHNPGLQAAQRVSEAFGAGVAVPQGITGTDWCDWRQERRAERLARRRRFVSESQVLKAVDEELAREIGRAAKFVVPV